MVEVVAQDGGGLVEEAGDLVVGPALEELFEELCVVAAARGDELLLDGGALWERGSLSAADGLEASMCESVWLLGRCGSWVVRVNLHRAPHHPCWLACGGSFVESETRCWRFGIGEVKLYTNSLRLLWRFQLLWQLRASVGAC